MSRTLKRVALDFNWPQGKVWKGYINPHTPLECPHCKNGYSAEYHRMLALWYSHLGGGFRPEMRGSTPYTPDDPLVVEIITRKVSRDAGSRQFYGTDTQGIRREAVRMCEIWNTSWSHHLNEQDVAALIESNRLIDFTHHWVKDTGWVKNDPFVMPTPKQVNDWSLSGFSHDSCNCWIVLKAELARLGLPSTCAECNGTGEAWSSDQHHAEHDAWKEFEPPAGDGYQLWETTTEGSPASPVCLSLDELCRWCEIHATTFGSNKTTAAEWRKMLEEDFVCHQEGNITFI